MTPGAYALLSILACIFCLVIVSTLWDYHHSLISTNGITVINEEVRCVTLIHTRLSYIHSCMHDTTLDVLYSRHVFTPM